MSQLTHVTLLRHAHAEPASRGQADADRPLSAEGEAEALAAATFLKQHPLPQRVLCSPAERTRATANAVLDVVGPIDLRIEPEVYEATPGALIDLIEANADVGHLLLVGHNPGLESLAALLATGQSGDHRGMPPGSVAVLSLDANTMIEPGTATLQAFWSP